MKSAIYCANHSSLASATVLVDLALRAEAAGWDGFFVYDHLVVAARHPAPTVDPWSVLAVVADRTELRLGPMITPLARRQPWDVAHQVLALDELSAHRFVLGIGLGEDADFRAVGLPTDARERAGRLDESLDVLTRLLAGERVVHRGGHWKIDNAALTRPADGPPIPIWIAGRFPYPRPMRRAARFAGAFPINTRWRLDDPLTPEQLSAQLEIVRGERGSLDGYEVATAGVTTGEPAQNSDRMAAYERAGATWWMEILESRRGDLETLRARVAVGPPTG